MSLVLRTHQTQNVSSTRRFYDDAANLRALAATNGNVSAAVERVLREFGM